MNISPLIWTHHRSKDHLIDFHRLEQAAIQQEDGAKTGKMHKMRKKEEWLTKS